MNVVAIKQQTEEVWHRRLALSIAASIAQQVPEKAQDALIIWALVQAAVNDVLAAGGA